MVLSSRRQNDAFTLVELLVVIAIIGILVALLLPAVQAAREAARRMSCGNNQKQLGLAVHNYHDTYKTFPPDAIWHGNARGTQSDANTVKNYTWITLILPFIEQSPLHDQINFSLPALREFNRIQVAGAPARELMLPALLCPSDPEIAGAPHGFGITSYAGSQGWDGHRRKRGDSQRAAAFSFYDATKVRDITDGTSNTIMLAEVTLRGGGGPAQRWAGGSGHKRQGRGTVSRSAFVAPAAWHGWNHSWVRAEQKGSVNRADGSSGPIWHPTWRAPYVMTPVFYTHWAPNTEWPSSGSFHPGGHQATLCDASVRFIPDTITNGLASRGGNNATLGINGNMWIAIHTIAGHRNAAQVVWP